MLELSATEHTLITELFSIFSATLDYQKDLLPFHSFPLGHGMSSSIMAAGAAAYGAHHMGYGAHHMGHGMHHGKHGKFKHGKHGKHGNFKHGIMGGKFKKWK